MDSLLQSLGDLSHHAPVLLAWALLRHTVSPGESTGTIRRMGSAAIQLNVFQYLTKLLRSLSNEGNVSFVGSRGEAPEAGSSLSRTYRPLHLNAPIAVLPGACRPEIRTR